MKDPQHAATYLELPDRTYRLTCSTCPWIDKADTRNQAHVRCFDHTCNPKGTA